MNKQQINYDKKHIEFLEKLWGEGYLSPGGSEEVSRILKDVVLSNKVVLDIGSGSGGVTTSLVTAYNAKKVIGIDIEDDVCAVAKDRVERLGLENKINILKVEPGSLPFENESFDLVFSKDSIVHIENKEDLSKEIFRILKSGGQFLCSDWLRSNDREPSPEMIHYLELEDLGFDMASPKRYQRALVAAGFKKIKLENRNSWYLDQAKSEILTLSTFNRDEFEKISSKKYMDLTIKTWDAMINVLKTGEHCPHHIRCTKP
tara:strand:- start:207 stop:986 length:780 start_codon:yes stop_codon:yes gene_type:complete